MPRTMINRALLIFPVVAIGVLLLTLGRNAVAQPNPSSDCAPPPYTRDWPITDFCNNSVDFDNILRGQVKDGIPAVDNPGMEPIAEAREWLDGRSPVIVVEVAGEARAYPHAILMFHEIANDTIADVPVAVTFCPLCNSSIVFDRRVEDDTLTFGVSGFLRNSDLIMFDRQTESWWQQFTGIGIVGEYNETVLDVLPSKVVSFDQFAEQHPDGLVMERPRATNYGRNPYVGYDTNQRPFLFLGETDPRLPAVERVLAGIIDGQPMAYAFADLADAHVINDTIGETSVVAFWQPGVVSSLDRADIASSRDIGTAVLFSRTVDEQELTFAWNAETETISDEQTGSTWNLFGEATAGELVGTELRQLIAAPHFWFAWAAFHPETTVYEASDAS